jgi:hypothetical protein
MKFRPLNAVHELMNKTGYEPAYAYDDLVFSTDAIFIVQFDDKNPSLLTLFINKDCIESERDRIKTIFTSHANDKNLTVKFDGSFELCESKQNESFDIVFSN